MARARGAVTVAWCVFWLLRRHCRVHDCALVLAQCRGSDWKIIISHRLCLGYSCGHLHVHGCGWCCTLEMEPLGNHVDAVVVMFREGSVAYDEEDFLAVGRRSEDGCLGPGFEGAAMAGQSDTNR